ncbi:MAG: DUF932 domain-containing protein [Candidatus Woesearchaeota archaeon]
MFMNPFFEVQRNPVFSNVNGQEIEIGRDALFNKETGKCLGVVTPDYKVIENRELNELVMNSIDDLPILKIKDHVNSSTNIWIREIILDGDQYTYEIGKKGDVLKTRILLQNSYGVGKAVSLTVSVWRQVCENGMFGFTNAFVSRYTHLTIDAIQKIRTDFENNAIQIEKNIDLWQKWSQKSYSRDKFNGFIDSITISENNNNGFITEKRAKVIKGLYEPVLNEYFEEENLWAAYNVLTAIGTHHTKARSGSNIFSGGYHMINKVANEFYKTYEIAA